MELTVKGIFKALIGTIVLIVVASMVTEMFNVSLQGIQLQQTARLALKQSATLFAQETYKERLDGIGVGGSVDMQDVLAADGTIYATGTFYGSGEVEDIYNKLYSKELSPNDGAFAKWVDDVGVQGNWKSINLLNQYLNGSFPITTMPDFERYRNAYSNIDAAYEAYEKDMDKYSDYIIAKSYVDSYMTPLNFGIPYMDRDVLETMFRWNVTQLFSNCNSEMIVPDERGVYAVRNNGFMLYTNQAKVTNIDYRIFDTEQEDQKQQLYDIIHMNPDALGFSDDLTYLGVDTDERRRVCIIGIEYEIPVSYIGVSPLKAIFNYVWDNEVEGYQGSNSGRTGHQEYNPGMGYMQGGGVHGNEAAAGVLPIPGKLVYYIVR